MSKQRIKVIGLAILIIVIGAAVVSISKSNASKISCNDCNVLIVGYDTVGTKHVSQFGYNRTTTPTLDSIANQGFGFSSNYSTAPWTVPSFMSMFTGMYPTEHKLINKYTTFNNSQQKLSNIDELSPGIETLAQQFKVNGYATGGFTGDSGVTGKFGYAKGFDVYTDETPFGSIQNSSNKALEWLELNQNKKFFMFLHGYDAHGQFAVDENYPKEGEFVPKDYIGPLNGSAQEEAELREKQLSQDLNLTKEDYEYLNGIYDSKIKDGDKRFAEFWKQFKKLGLEKNTVVIIVSDHGEEWGEHGGVDHGHSLYNELVNTPLVFKIPGAEPNPNIDQKVTSLDIAPTVLGITGINSSDKYNSQLKGTNLTPVMKGSSVDAKDIYLETDYRDHTHIRGVISTDNWKYIITMQNKKEELYNLNIDPSESNNVANAKQNAQKLSQLRDKVRSHLKQMDDNPDKTWTTGCLPVYPSECKQ